MQFCQQLLCVGHENAAGTAPWTQYCTLQNLFWRVEFGFVLTVSIYATFWFLLGENSIQLQVSGKSVANLVSQRYNVASHELYLGQIFAAGLSQSSLSRITSPGPSVRFRFSSNVWPSIGGSGNIYQAHYRGRIVAAKEIVNTDSRTNSYTELSVRIASVSLPHKLPFPSFLHSPSCLPSVLTFFSAAILIIRCLPQNEAVILQHIDQDQRFHPNIVEFRGLCKHLDERMGKTRLMIIMEYCETSLDKVWHCDYSFCYLSGVVVVLYFLFVICVLVILFMLNNGEWFYSLE